jgi:hypothetical protein
MKKSRVSRPERSANVKIIWKPCCSDIFTSKELSPVKNIQSIVTDSTEKTFGKWFWEIFPGMADTGSVYKVRRHVLWRR